MNDSRIVRVHPFWSYGFRPFFFSAALFAGIAIPVWVLLLSGMSELELHYTPREWHVHEMVFGFLPCVMAGFLLTAMPNWTERPPIQGRPLQILLGIWVLGRVGMTVPGVPQVVLAIVDSAFLVILAGLVWMEIVSSQAWSRSPIAVLISLYATANMLFHTLLLNHVTPDLTERLALGLIMVLLALIGGRVTPGFTEDFLEEHRYVQRPSPFSVLDGLAIGSLVIAISLWVILSGKSIVGWVFFGAGIIHFGRMSRWYGWLTWKEPLVGILHLGYAWLAMSMVLLGGAMLGVGLPQEDAIHALTTGAVGIMTLGIMTRASLGHTGRLKHAGPLTVLIYVLVTMGAVVRVFGLNVNLLNPMTLVLAAGCWSGAYVLFAVSYGHMLFQPGLDEEEASPA